MDYKSIENKNAKVNLKNCFLVFLICIFFIILMPVKAAAAQNVKNIIDYKYILQYTISSFNGITLDKDENDQSNFSIQSEILKFVGLDISDPYSMIGNVLSYLPKAAQTNIQVNNSDINPFKFDDSKVTKLKNPENANENINLPDKTVNTYDPQLKKDLSNGKPDVLIYHTHTCESYSPGPPNTQDQTKSVCAVGDTLKDELEKNYGIAVIHDKTVHDIYSYIQSYSRSAVTVDKYLKTYGDFKLVIDIHRDSIEDKATETIKLNGVNTAKFMLVTAENNPHAAKNLVVVNKIVSISNKLFPGLCRGIFPYAHGKAYFNQDKSNNSILIEVGSDINTTDEAKNTSKYLATIIAEYLNGK
jgi:stage II sporulation protein P